MIDEVSIHTRLESELLAALTHATETIAATVHADAAAACVYDAPPRTPTCYVSAARLGLRSAEEASLQHWPQDPDGLPEFLRQREEKDRVFRVRHLMDELAYARQRFFRRFEPFTTVTDAICVTASIPDEGGTWFAVTLLRCGNHSPFPDSTLQALDRLRPVLARVIRKGLQRETQPRGFELARQEGQIVHQPVSTSQLLAKLSRTELHVLNHLRSAMTERRIADEIGRSPHTVHVHVKNIYRKLGVSSRKGLLELFSDE